jgi:hypothetical protein
MLLIKCVLVFWKCKPDAFGSCSPAFRCSFAFGFFVVDNYQSGKGCRCNPVYEQRIGVSNLVLRPFIAADSWPAKRDRNGSFLPA